MLQASAACSSRGAQARLLQAVRECCSCVQGRAARQPRDCNDRCAELWSVPSAPAGECEAAFLGSWRVSSWSAGTALLAKKGAPEDTLHPA